MIKISNLTVIIDNQTIFNNLDLMVNINKIVALSGSSGCGKSTLLKTVIGRHIPAEGGIIINNMKLSLFNIDKIRKLTFYLPQDIRAFDDETVEQFLEYPFSLTVNKNLEFSKQTALDYCDELLLKPEIMTRQISTLSGGERKRVGLMRGLLLKKSVFLLDEPTSGVDREASDKIVNILRSLKDTTTLIITHDKNLIASVDYHVDFVSLHRRINN